MTDHEHDGMKKCTKCGEWKPATAEFFYRDKTKKGGLRAQCIECVREYREKNKEKRREYEQSPVGRLAKSIKYLREKTGATIYLRDMTDEEKETLANQCVAARTLEKTEKELLSVSGKKRCPACDRILDYGCFNKNITKNDGVCSWCGECRAEYKRKYHQQNKDKMKDYYRERYQQNKDKKKEYYEKNKEHYREYYEKNKDKIKEYDREYYQKNKDKKKEYNRKYRQNKKNKKVLDKTKSIPDNRE